MKYWSLPPSSFLPPLSLSTLLRVPHTTGDSHVAGDDVNEIFPMRAPPPLGESRSAGQQAAYQLAVLAAALAGGWAAGKVASLPCFRPLARPWQMFEDGLFWELPGDEDEDGDGDDGNEGGHGKKRKEEKNRGGDGVVSVTALRLQLLKLQEAIDKIERQQPVASP